MKSLFYVFILLFCFTIATKAQIAKVKTGSLVHLGLLDSKFVKSRQVDVWLPNGYDTNKKYAVLYMHDGQMLFDSTITWNHQAWRVDEILGDLMTKQKVKDCIVVGVWNTDKRHTEYFPQKAFESLSQHHKDSIYKANNVPGSQINSILQADNYLQFLVKELKPQIDKQFSTYKDQSRTFIAGSSMGGLISMYAICEYPEVFGGAACISTHWPGFNANENNPIPAEFMKYLKAKLPDPKTHKLYFDYGSLTLDALYKPYQEQADHIMKAKGYDAKNWITREFIGADHSEKAWNKRFDIPMVFLLGGNE